MYKIELTIPGVSTMNGEPVAVEMSYTESVEYFGRDNFKAMLKGEVPNVKAYPIEEAA